ncbi:hypothetical protein RJ639_038072 [Escallonia herrerae]|uniref:Thioesterase domain-containing protein n=1 Tax=Escallonia herrerae TaxID=1293975 RepID=A0AA89B6X0_9ASTE|nr:hypothetical protein RJ639_038072 [Escallonia herrerae]
MDLESVKRYLEKDEAGNGATVDSIPYKFFEPFIVQGITVDVVQPGRVVCTMKVPDRLLNTGNFLHGGATATLVDIMGSAAIATLGAPMTGVSVEINTQYIQSVQKEETQQDPLRAKNIQDGRHPRRKGFGKGP